MELEILVKERNCPHLIPTPQPHPHLQDLLPKLTGVLPYPQKQRTKGQGWAQQGPWTPVAEWGYSKINL